MAFNMERDELDEKLNEEYSSSMKCFLRGSHHSKSTEMLTASKSRRSSSSGHFSAFVATEDSDGRTEVSGETQLSHYYDILKKCPIAQIMTRIQCYEPKKEMFLQNLKFPITTSHYKAPKGT